MTTTKRSAALAAASALLCLAPPCAQAAGPLFTAGGPVIASGSTLITFGDGTGQSATPPAIPPGDRPASGLTDAFAPKPVTLLPASLSPAQGALRQDGLPSPPKITDVPEPPETATLGLGVLMLGGLVLLARKRFAASAS